MHSKARTLKDSCFHRVSFISPPFVPFLLRVIVSALLRFPLISTRLCLVLQLRGKHEISVSQLSSLWTLEGNECAATSCQDERDREVSSPKFLQLRSMLTLSGSTQYSKGPVMMGAKVKQVKVKEELG